MTNKINISYEHCSIDELSPAEQEVVQAAFGATSKAYAPFHWNKEPLKMERVKGFVQE